MLNDLINISWSTVWSVLNSLLLLYLQVEDYQNVLKLRCWPLAFISYRVLSKNKKRSEISFPASFFAWFLKKSILLYISNWSNFVVRLLLLLEILGNMYFVFCFSIGDVINFEIKANHLVCTARRWYESRISTDCQRKLFFLRHDTNWRFLFVTFLENKKEDGTQK